MQSEAGGERGEAGSPRPVERFAVRSAAEPEDPPASPRTSTATAEPLLQAHRLQQGAHAKQPRRAGRATSSAILPGQVLLVGLATVSTRRLERLAISAPTLLAALPVAQYTLAGVALSGCAYWLRRSQQSGVGRPTLSPSVSADGASGAGRLANAATQRRRAWLAGGAVAIAECIRVCQMLRGSSSLDETLELFAVPSVLAVSILARSRILHALEWNPVPSRRAVTFFGSLTFFLAFLLIGMPFGAITFALAMTRVALLGISAVLVKDGVSEAGSAIGFAQNAALCAAGVSLAALPVLRLLAPATVKPASSSALLWPLVFSLASHITYYALLIASTDALTPTLALFPRNLLLLRWPARSAASPLFQQRWTQFSLLYLAGSVGSLWASDDLGGFRIPGWRRGSDDEEGARVLQLDDFDLPTPPPLYRRHSGEYGANSDSKSSSRPSRLLLSLLPFLPLLFAAALSPLSFVRLDNSCRLLPAAVRSSVCPFLVPVGTPRTVDIVISYYDENLEETREHIRNLRLSQFVAARHDRVILYNKGPHSEELLRNSLNLSESDDVVPLENLGREGGTYLSHILLHYNQTVAGLAPWDVPSTSQPSAPLAAAAAHLSRRDFADMTYFFQPHLAWGGDAGPRLEKVTDRTGFVHFGPNIRLECGKDTEVGVQLDLIAPVYAMFRGEICRPEVGQSGGWSGQFGVSKRRLLANPYSRYAYLASLLEAPAGHWIHSQWGPNDSGGPSNPSFGHVVERAWPSIFDCGDPRIAELCPHGEADPEKCHCFDGDEEIVV